LWEHYYKEALAFDGYTVKSYYLIGIYLSFRKRELRVTWYQYCCI